MAPGRDLLAESIINEELRVIADGMIRAGATEKERRAAAILAVNTCSAYRANAVAMLARSDRSIAVMSAALDRDSWALNTPGGIVDLKSGALHAPDPDALCTKSTAVTPLMGGAHPLWTRFLEEATSGSAELVAYLQRLGGYCLTGSTREQQLTFVWGNGENGKGVWLRTMAAIMGDYATHAAMTTFTASSSEKHTTDIARLMGARLVTAVETEQGKRWDEALVKSLTGEDTVTARFMRQDSFEYRPQFKLVFTGNYKPETRDVGHAMRRRLHLVPFTFEPQVKDKALEEKLRPEWPAILGWLVEGCLLWQALELSPPQIVVDATTEYFRDEDSLGIWLLENCEEGDGYAETTMALFDNWSDWARRNNLYQGSVIRFAGGMRGRGFPKWSDPRTRRHGFGGVRLLHRGDGWGGENDEAAAAA